MRRQPKAVRRRIGLVFQEQTLNDQLTAGENLRFHAALYQVPNAEVDRRIDRVLDLVALKERRKDLVSTFSGGMARRLEIARSVLHTPAVLLLDEPTVGLDPQTRALMWEDVTRLRREEGVTILLTTHYMHEAESAHVLGASTAALVASVAGVLPSYLMSRYWIWPEADRRRPGRQAVGFWILALVSLGLSALLTGVAAADGPPRHLAVVVGAASVGTYGVPWVAKFAVYQRFLFIARAAR